jgi:hypothetical protein
LCIGFNLDYVSENGIHDHICYSGSQLSEIQEPHPQPTPRKR